MEPIKTTKSLRRRKRRGSMSEPEKIVRAVQAVAVAGVVAYKVLKPHLKKLKLKRKNKKGKQLSEQT